MQQTNQSLLGSGMHYDAQLAGHSIQQTYQSPWSSGAIGGLEASAPVMQAYLRTDMSPDDKMTRLDRRVKLTGSCVTSKSEKLLEEFSREKRTSIVHILGVLIVSE